MHAERLQDIVTNKLGYMHLRSGRSKIMYIENTASPFPVKCPSLAIKQAFYTILMIIWCVYGTKSRWSLTFKLHSFNRSYPVQLLSPDKVLIGLTYTSWCNTTPLTRLLANSLFIFMYGQAVSLVTTVSSYSSREFLRR